MARFADLLTRASEGRLTFNRFDGGLIIADAIHASLETQAPPDGALYIEDEIFIDGNHLDLARYTSILPPFDAFWIEAKSSLHKGQWIGALCKAYHQDARLPHKGWLLSMYPVCAEERGGGRMQILYPRTLQMVFLDPEGHLMSPRPMIQQAPDLHRQFQAALRQPGLAVDVAVNCAPLVLETLALMSCVNVSTETVTPPAAQSKASEKKYGAPMSVYKILRFKGRNLSEAPAHQGGTHASPREHKVRRHYKWRGGKRFYVSPYLRGNPELGRVAKTYKIELPEDHDGH